MVVARGQELPVFIGSTFRDMDEERDVLTRIVFPLVNGRLREHGYNATLYPVDLRWGIETGEHPDSPSRQRTVIDICVKEVRRCRPLFIGLLGDRCGTPARPDVARMALQAAGLPDPGLPLSVTIIEMLAALHDRDGVAPILLARDLGVDPPAVADLKQYFAARGKPFRHYRVRESDDQREWTNEDFLPLAATELFAAVESRLTRVTPGTWLEEELAIQLATAEEEAQALIGRESELAEIARHWDPAGGEPLQPIGDSTDNPLWRLRRQHESGTAAVIGPSGAGKSALLAKVALDLPVHGVPPADRSRRAFVRVGLTTASTHLPVCVLTLLAQLNPAAAQAIAEVSTPDTLEFTDVVSAWMSTLHSATVQEPLLIVCDGLDQFTKTNLTTVSLAWLPPAIGDRVRVVVSAADDSLETFRLALRPHTQMIELGELEPDDAAELVRRRVAARHRSLPANPMAALLARSCSPRWLIVATDLLLTLMAYDYLAVQNADPAVHPEAALRAMLTTMADTLPPDLGELHFVAYHRLMGLLGQPFTEPLFLLSIATLGLDESTLRATLAGCRSPLTQADLALLRDVFSTHLHVQHGTWRFRHRSAAEAALHLLSVADEEADSDLWAYYRIRLAEQLLSQAQDSPMRVRYLLPLLFANGAYGEMLRQLADPELTPEEAHYPLNTVVGSLLESAADFSALLGELRSAGPSDVELLTILQFLVMQLTTLPNAEAVTASAELREVIAEIDDEVVNRFRMGPRELAELLTAIVPDIRKELSRPKLILPDEVITSQPGSLRQLAELQLGPSPVQRASTIIGIAGVLAELAGTVAAGMVVPQPDDGLETRRRLDALYELQDDEVLAGGNIMPEILALHLATAERAGAAAWPGLGFRPVEGDFRRCQALCDFDTGNHSLVALLANNARMHAMALLVHAGLPAEPSLQTAAAAAQALDYLEEARSHLNLQLLLTPELLSIEMATIQNGIQQITVLTGYEQHGSAYAIGMETLMLPNAVQLTGRRMFIRLAAQVLTSYLHSERPLNPDALVMRLADVLNSRMPEDLTPQEYSATVYLLLTSSLLGVVHGGASAPLIAQRACDELRAESLQDQTTLPFTALMRGGLAQIEDQTLDDLASMRLRGDEAGRAALDRRCSTLDELRLVLLSYDGGLPADTLGLVLTMALRAGLLGTPCSAAEIELARRAVRGHTHDERLTRVAAAVTELLGLAEW